ncbi:MAG: UDP-N-acetylmuramoyl-tripeptide--D-alanyl-D-alanine ligase, partial [Deltaproteobacteria bacterium]|nr:UDP-N-acetylmuramoyl-tripeptide--D-alanyl-D-alanine ligase [Deltaproteobacteria bacterium]
AGPCHLEGLGSVRGVCVAKASLLAHLPAHGQALVNQDYPELFQAASAVKPLPTPFSALDASAPISCLYQGLGPDGRGRYLLRLSGREIMLNTAFSGRAMAENLAAAAGAAFLLGLPLEAIRDGIAASAPIDGRFHIRGQGRRTLIDDSYNANPLSMRLALERARELAGARPLVLVLGEMLELGPAREDEHRRLAALASSVSCAALFFHGSSWSAVQDGYRGPQGTLHQLQCPSDLVRAMQSGLVPADAVVLFKGSRGSRMDRFLQAMGGQA